MNAFVVQINTSDGGAPKNSVEQACITKRGLEGDHNRCRIRKGDPENLRAVLLYPLEYIEWLRGLGFPVYPGALGENITTQGIDFKPLRFGDRLRIGEVELEICKTRTPCMGIGDFGGQLLLDTIWEPDAKHNPASPRWSYSGFFAKVLREGTVRKGHPIELLLLKAAEH
jgi:MOSC domain-containing protein YiiM